MRSFCFVIFTCMLGAAAAPGDGFLERDGAPLFPIGFYALPEDDADLQRMAESGVNLLRAGSVEDLDRLEAAGVLGWVPLSVQQGATEALEARVNLLKDHPALAIWEGPDEIVWTFTAMSTLEESAGFTRRDWETQQPKAVAYAEEQAAILIPNMIEGIELVRRLDERNLPFWHNEARSSDAKYMRMFLDHLDVVGCDDYPVRPVGTDLNRPVRATDRWRLLGRGKPVYMVLQAFSWNEIGRGDVPAWPSFTQSRYMAYATIAHGAAGVLYWGSDYLGNEDFRTSLYALTSELDALQPFLTARDVPEVGITLFEAVDYPGCLGVAKLARRAGGDWLIAVINRDDFPHLGVEVNGLEAGLELGLLYGEERVTVDVHGTFVTRLQPYEVKVFSTSRAYESSQRAGRDFE